MLPHPEPPFSFFRFSRNERFAALVLILIGFVGMASAYWLPAIWPREPVNTTVDPELQAQFDDWIARTEARQDSIDAAREAKYASFRENRSARSTYTRSEPAWKTKKEERKRRALAVEIDYSRPLPAAASLNPNTADSADLKRLGIPVAIVRRWYKFRAAGATFVKRSDISKLYGLQDSTYQRIAPYFLDDAELKTNFKAKSKTAPASPAESETKRAKTAPAERLELNTATEEQLLAIRGIGPYYAKLILDERDGLGGFLSLDQVANIKGFREDAFERFEDAITVDPTELIKLLINHVDERRLAKHPYINRDDARVLIAYRSNHGPYRSLEDLYATIAVDSATVQRLAPYLSFD